MTSELKTKIIWLALVASQLLLAVLLMNMAKTGRAPVELPEQTRQMLMGMGVINWFLAWVMPTVFLRSIAARANDLKPENIQVISVVQWALFESVSLFGFIQGSNAISVQPMLPFLAAGLLGMLLSFPTNRRTEKLIQSFETYRVR